MEWDGDKLEQRHLLMDARDVILDSKKGGNTGFFQES